MMEEEKNIEKLFRDKFEDFEVEPSASLWNKISWNLAVREFLSFSFARLNLWYVLMVGGLITGLIYAGIEFAEADEFKTLESGILEEVKPVGVIDTVSLVEPEIDDDLLRESLTVPVAESDLLDDVQDAVIEYESQVSEELTDITNNLPGIIELPVKEVEENFVAEITEDPVSELNNRPQAEFDSYPPFGCNNLRVQFTNRSENAESFRWQFGDGGTSSEKNPIYFYDKPGRYVVTLEVFSSDGTADKSHGTIEVYNKPSAVFEVSTEEENGFGRTVYFYNYSANAEKYLWDFGDGNHSTDISPIHTYTGSGNFGVTLKAISQNGCEDVMIMENLFSGEYYFLNFPNALIPDVGGPSDGAYNPADPVTKIFFPQYKGVAEYQLSIYSKTGLLLFETHNIGTGWNGYYNNRIVAPGVYIWKARGRFENGQPFVKAGDVTVIMNN
jgi:PKD repeat protein